MKTFACKFHLKRGHHQHIPFPLVRGVFGEQLFDGVNNTGLHKLVRNDISLSVGMEWTPKPREVANYSTLADALEDMERHKRYHQAKNVWWKQVVKRVKRDFGIPYALWFFRRWRWSIFLLWWEFCCLRSAFCVLDEFESILYLYDTNFFFFFCILDEHGFLMFACGVPLCFHFLWIPSEKKRACKFYFILNCQTRVNPTILPIRLDLNLYLMQIESKFTSNLWEKHNAVVEISVGIVSNQIWEPISLFCFYNNLFGPFSLKVRFWA